MKEKPVIHSSWKKLLMVLQLEVTERRLEETVKPSKGNEGVTEEAIHFIVVGSSS